MDLPTLREFESELISQGYSRSYARRFADELLDHSLELDQQSETEQCSEDDGTKIPQQIGTLQSLSAAVNSYDELDPVPRKFPFVCFVVAPAIVLNLWICFALYWIYELANAGQQPQRVFAVNFTNTVYYLLLLLLPIAAIWASNRYRVSKWYVGLLTLGLSMSSLFGTSVATCQNSQSAFIHSDWSFRWWQFLLPIAALIVSQAALAKRSRTGFVWQDKLNPINSEPVRLALNSVLLVIVIAISGYLISGSIESLRNHPIDNLVKGFNDPVSQARRFLSVLKSPENPLEPPIREQIDHRIEEYQSEIKAIYANLDTSDQESWQQANSASNTLTLRAYDEVTGMLTPKQTELIGRIALQQQGWLAMFDPNVRHQLDVSAYQFLRFKDTHLESIKNNNRLNREWRNAEDKDKPSIVNKIEASRSQTNATYASILSAKQLKKMDQSYGTDFYQEYYGQEIPFVQNR